MRNVEAMAKKHGLEKLAFLTLTFSDQCADRIEAQKRFNSLNSNVLRKRYADYIAVFERQKSGAIHYHLLVLLSFNCRDAFNFERLKAATDGEKSGKDSGRHCIHPDMKCWENGHSGERHAVPTNLGATNCCL